MPAELLGEEDAKYDKLTDTLDVWFDSGTTHWHVLRGSHPDGRPRRRWPGAPTCTSKVRISIAAGSSPRC
jgi:isoleucyl-tRNA synthetase